MCLIICNWSSCSLLDGDHSKNVSLLQNYNNILNAIYRYCKSLLKQVFKLLPDLFEKLFKFSYFKLIMRDLSSIMLQ